MALSITGNGLIVGSSNLIEICQRPEGCNREHPNFAISINA
jgi:hypothetical protein